MNTYPTCRHPDSSSGERCPVRLSDSTSSFLYSKRRNSWSKLAQVPEQSKFTHSDSLVAAGHLCKGYPEVKPRERGSVRVDLGEKNSSSSPGEERVRLRIAK